MTFGLKIFNDAGSVQVDDTYKNLALRGKPSVTTSTSTIGTAGRHPWSASFAASPANPLIAIAPTSYAGIYAGNNSSGTHSFYGYAYDGGASIPTFIFDNPETTPPDSGFGLAVMDDAGECTFNSLLNYMRVVDFIPNADPRDTITEASYTYPAGRDYAFISCNACTSTIVAPFGLDPSQVIATQWILGGKVSGNTLIFRSLIFQVASGSAGMSGIGQYAPKVPVLVIDITNY